MVENTTSFFDKKDGQGLVESIPTAVATPVDAAQEEQPPTVLRSLSSGGSSSETNHTPTDKTVASGATGAVLGFLFGGPILSALLGFGAAYVSKKDGAPGDAARALGDVGLSVKKTAAEVDEKHRIVEKSSKVAANAWDGAQKYDQKHHVLDHSKSFAVANWESFVHFMRENRILQKGVDGFGKGYEFVAEKVVGRCGQNTTMDETTAAANSTAKTAKQ